MKILLGAGVLLTIAGSSATNAGVSGGWMVQSGITLLIAALVVFANRKRFTSGHQTLWRWVELISFGFLLFLAAWGALTEVWYEHPLGGLIQIAVCGWAIYHCFIRNHQQSSKLV